MNSYTDLYQHSKTPLGFAPQPLSAQEGAGVSVITPKGGDGVAAQELNPDATPELPHRTPQPAARRPGVSSDVFPPGRTPGPTSDPSLFIKPAAGSGDASRVGVWKTPPAPQEALQPRIIFDDTPFPYEQLGPGDVHRAAPSGAGLSPSGRGEFGAIKLPELRVAGQPLHGPNGSPDVRAAHPAVKPNAPDPGAVTGEHPKISAGTGRSPDRIKIWEAPEGVPRTPPASLNQPIKGAHLGPPDSVKAVPGLVADPHAQARVHTVPTPEQIEAMRPAPAVTPANLAAKAGKLAGHGMAIGGMAASGVAAYEALKKGDATEAGLHVGAGAVSGAGLTSTFARHAGKMGVAGAALGVAVQVHNEKGHFIEHGPDGKISAGAKTERAVAGAVTAGAALGAGALATGTATLAGGAALTGAGAVAAGLIAPLAASGVAAAQVGKTTEAVLEHRRADTAFEASLRDKAIAPKAQPAGKPPVFGGHLPQVLSQVSTRLDAKWLVLKPGSQPLKVGKDGFIDGVEARKIDMTNPKNVAALKKALGDEIAHQNHLAEENSSAAPNWLRSDGVKLIAQVAAGPAGAALAQTNVLDGETAGKEMKAKSALSVLSPGMEELLTYEKNLDGYHRNHPGNATVAQGSTVTPKNAQHVASGSTNGKHYMDDHRLKVDPITPKFTASAQDANRPAPATPSGPAIAAAAPKSQKLGAPA